MRILCPPAAAMRMARFAYCYPTIWEKSTSSCGLCDSISAIEEADCTTIGSEPESIRTISAIFFAGTISTQGISAASIAFSSGTITRLYHFSFAKITVGRTAWTARTAPSRASSPITNVSLRIVWSILHSSRRIQRAIGRSKLGVDYLISAGAIDSDFCTRKWEIGIFDSTSDTFPTFLNSGIWKSDDDKSWHAVVDVDFDLYELSVESWDHDRIYFCNHRNILRVSIDCKI